MASLIDNEALLTAGIVTSDSAEDTAPDDDIISTAVTPEPMSVEQRWFHATGVGVPSALTGLLLTAALQYEEQCKASGGLTLQQKRHLASVAKANVPGTVSKERTRSDSTLLGEALTHPPSGKARHKRSFAIGTEFHREWKGRVHIVMTTADGFLWSGQTYRSLSAVARAITGTRWNGLRFFGVDRKATGS
ncbi:DUF2924 domain-containing protein [Pseudahrensia aquimaris]|uniref:DUF2924 domain-containing protein n=1 Tax=Pseudahrensia aquimaris TaxID=744461 RepID=A0ABW3FGH7_9HYPH